MYQGGVEFEVVIGKRAGKPLQRLRSLLGEQPEQLPVEIRVVVGVLQTLCGVQQGASRLSGLLR